MNTLPHANKWSVLILCTGHGNELLRSFVRSVVEGLGFDAHVYDAPGYPVDPSVHSHAACVEAISSHDIVLAFADKSEGGEFQVEQAPQAMVSHLRDKGILPVEGSPSSIPTIFQVEVMTARDLGKPTIVFLPKEIQSRIDQTITQLRENSNELQPRPGVSIDPSPLIQRAEWDELHALFEVESGRIASFRQIAFLEKLRKESPNFISFYTEGNHEELQQDIKSRLSGVADVLIREHIKLVNSRIETKRDPIVTFSLQDLISRRLIIASPFETLSGTMTAPLFSGEGSEGEIAKSLIIERDVLLLGHPGLGKTTASLISFRDLAKEAEAGVEGYAPLYASWRTLPISFAPETDTTENRFTVDGFIRTLLGLPRHRAPWPIALELPRKKWILVLDGLDESSLDRSSLIKLLKALTEDATLFVTCRQINFERHLQNSKDCFHEVIQLLPWQQDDINKYLQALRESGQEKAFEFINERLESGQLPDFISIPLWLSMLTYLAERSIRNSSKINISGTNVYDLFRQCSDAVAEDEIGRNSVTVGTVDDLKKLWARVAWELHKARREGRAVLIKEFEQFIDLKDDVPLEKAVFALLDIFSYRVVGFFHEVFQEYWLAEFLVDLLADEGIRDKDIANYFSYQRSVVTNRFIRQRIRSAENVQQISTRLQRAFRAADEIGSRSLFAKNQLVYLLGRIDDSQGNRNFLHSLWESSSEPPFVKHSAAFAAIMLGESKIESEYYNLLNDSPHDDEMNRGYHLYYYGDIDADENAMPVVDDSQDEAEATLRQLFKRLNRTESRHLNLRRIEMFTIRRFLETDRKIPGDIHNANDIILRVVEGARAHRMGDEYIHGVEAEAIRILELL